jgi:adenylate kinase family enzyme
MIELIESIMNGEKLIMLLGLHGVGKSCVAKQVIHYIYERKFMTGGMWWVQLKGVRDVYAVIKQIQSFIYKDLRLTKDETHELIQKGCNEKDLLEFITDFLGNPNKKEYRKKLKRSRDVKVINTDFLICFDNAEEIIEHK